MYSEVRYKVLSGAYFKLRLLELPGHISFKFHLEKWQPYPAQKTIYSPKLLYVQI